MSTLTATITEIVLPGILAFLLLLLIITLIEGAFTKRKEQIEMHDSIRNRRLKNTPERGDVNFSASTAAYPDSKKGDTNQFEDDIAIFYNRDSGDSGYSGGSDGGGD